MKDQVFNAILEAGNAVNLEGMVKTEFRPGTSRNLVKGIVLNGWEEMAMLLGLAHKKAEANGDTGLAADITDAMVGGEIESESVYDKVVFF